MIQLNAVTLKLPRIYPITNRQLTGLSHAEQVKRLIAGGASIIQLRDKLAAPDDFYRDACEALRIARARDVKIIMNDRVDIALALNADGVHLGQDDIPIDAARYLLKEDVVIGISTHNLAQAKIAASLPVDYVAIGPIFGTITKSNPDPVVGLEVLREVRSIVSPKPLVAIGGITSKTAASTLRAGADSLAIISQLLTDATNITQNLMRMLSITEFPS